MSHLVFRPIFLLFSQEEASFGPEQQACVYRILKAYANLCP